MDTSSFTPLFSALAEISGFIIEVWDKDGLVYSTRQERPQPGRFDEIGLFSALIIGRRSFQVSRAENGHLLGGFPLKDEEIIGALVAHDEAVLTQSSFRDAFEKNPATLERFLRSLAGIVEERWTSQRESEKMVEELTQHMGDLSLYGRISDQVKPLMFSGDMLQGLIDELLDALGIDIAFSLFPDHRDYASLAFKEKPGLTKIEPSDFVETLISLIPTGAPSLKENYFIINDSQLNPDYRPVHPDPFRFLAVAIRDDQRFFGWLGLVSFNMKEIFRQSELKLLKSLAQSTAVALENTRLYQESLLMAQKERSIRNIFQKYVPAAVANEILDRGERELIQLGEKRRVTLLNVDIRGYSRMSKTCQAEEIVTILNHFFMIMGNVILNHGGMLDKYLGDGILAVFGAPIPTENPALDATLAALGMMDQREDVDKFTRKKFGFPMNIGISIHTGEVILGNIGFERKMEYTVIGDVVNDTFRLQELTRETPNSILISSNTQQEVEPFVVTRKLGLRILGTHGSEMEVHEVVGVR